MQATGESYSTARAKLEAEKECHNCGAPLAKPAGQNTAARYCESCQASKPRKVMTVAEERGIDVRGPGRVEGQAAKLRDGAS